jgi:hypothetical protein
MNRAVISEELAAACPTITWTGRVGYSSAIALRTAIGIAAKAALNLRKLRRSTAHPLHRF